MEKINKIIIKKWLIALRSGQYVQGTGMLKSIDNKFCCLGVLCDIVDPTQWKEEGNHYTYKDLAGVLTDDIHSKVGINPSGLLSKSYYGSYTLVSLNDVAKKDFKVIADVIEEEFLKNKWHHKVYRYVANVISKYFKPWKK